MGTRTSARLLAVMMACGALAAPAAAEEAQSRGRGAKAWQGIVSGPPGEAPRREVRAFAQRPGRPQEPAFAAGYESGYAKGLADGRDGERYDPGRHADYRDGERGYTKEYGSREAYRTNYRAGFRQAYEEGYREGARSR